jgi:hypothetical protein
LVQRTCLYLVPLWLGGNAVAGYSATTGFSSGSHVTWKPLGDNMVMVLDWLPDGQQEGACLPD